MAVEDLAQEVFARVFERLPRYAPRHGIPFEHWVSRLAVRTCLDALRSERRRPEVRLSDLSEGEGDWLQYLLSGTEETSPGDATDARAMVERLLGLLSPEDRLVISWLDLEEKSAAEVSDLTGWSRVGVRVRAFRARARLRKAAETLNERGER
jgi:RNA polymerase sigma-70 factor (ECF subfamily)